ncbi:MAG: glycine betaine/L-proline ABC transporter ATP-binding protein [Alphaproteobacteria bacterium]|nr:glycine betaine/L-proline ABC transporter ATP-binding protein [Alphaproteobacteria bacterium]MCY4495834.1 glycine betaine/L-proline ABC transporter ATP-binding protein [Rhodospirillaceae bacterium]
MGTNPGVKVQIRSLYKIFGPDAAAMTEHVEAGISKEDLLDKHAHVLGLRNINLDVAAHQVQVIMGLSGSGKSTLIRHINRLIEPTAGEVIVDGEDILAMTPLELRQFRRSKASMVFQGFALLPHRTVADNVAYGLSVQGIDKAEREERGKRWIDRVGLTGYEGYYTTHLSGGMRQRVGLARALATDAEILLMDEPFSALDPLIRTDMQDILLGLQTELHKTIIFITHDLDEALRIGNSIAILRDGEAVQVGTPQDIIMRPADGYVAEFIKDINRGRVIQVASIMDAEKADGGPKVDAETVLDDALQLMIGSGSDIATVTRNGEPAGSVRLESIATALAKPD